METVISVSDAGICDFAGSAMSSTFDKAADRKFIHSEYPGCKGDGEIVIFVLVALKH